MKYFCVCDDCGSTEWIEIDGNHTSLTNGLTEDGDTMVENIISDYYNELDIAIRVPKLKPDLRKSLFHMICSDCEGKTVPIFFKEVSKSLRKKLYFMSNEEKINWIKGYLVAEKLNKENTNNG